MGPTPTPPSPPQAAKAPIEAAKANKEAAEAAKSPLPDSDLSDEEAGAPSKENQPAGELGARLRPAGLWKYDVPLEGGPARGRSAPACGVLSVSKGPACWTAPSSHTAQAMTV